MTYRTIETIIIAVSAIVCIFFVVLVVKSVGNKEGYQRGYLQAAKDFYKGKVKADLITNEDGSKEWVYLGDKKK